METDLQYMYQTGNWFPQKRSWKAQYLCYICPFWGTFSLLTTEPPKKRWWLVCPSYLFPFATLLLSIFKVSELKEGFIQRILLMVSKKCTQEWTKPCKWWDKLSSSTELNRMNHQEWLWIQEPPRSTVESTRVVVVLKKRVKRRRHLWMQQVRSSKKNPANNKEKVELLATKTHTQMPKYKTSSLSVWWLLAFSEACSLSPIPCLYIQTEIKDDTLRSIHIGADWPPVWQNVANEQNNREKNVGWPGMGCKTNYVNIST